MKNSLRLNFGVLESRHSLLRRRVQGGISTNQAHLSRDHRYIYTQELQGSTLPITMIG